MQTGTSHGGVPLADGSIAQAKIDFEVLRETTHICREEYGMAGSVQHGASTLPESVFNKFPEAEAVEIHLATGFQNMILDAPTLPQDIKDGIRDFCFEHCLDERKPEQTDEQFVYTTRKKALGPFKRRMWEMDDAHKEADHRRARSEVRVPDGKARRPQHEGHRGDATSKPNPPISPRTPRRQRS